MRSARRWYWLTTSDQAAFTLSSCCCRALYPQPDNVSNAAPSKAVIHARIGFSSTHKPGPVDPGGCGLSHGDRSAVDQGQKKPQVLRPGVWKGGPSMKGRKSARGLVQS